jgi:hypothetical protein
MASYTCLAGILLALDQHLDSTRLEGDVGENGEWVARCRTTVNGRRGLPKEIKHLQDVRFLNCGQPRGLQSREMESQKVEQNNGYIIEDMNAAAVVYANYSKSRSNARDA